MSGEKEQEKKCEGEKDREVRRSQVIAVIRDRRGVSRGKVQLTPRRFVPIKRFEMETKTFRQLSPEEIQCYREFGYIPKSSKDATRILRFRCDLDTLKQIKAFQKTLPNFNMSETIRYLLIKGLEHSKSSPEVKLKLPQELYERLEEHRRLFNKTEDLNLSLNEFIQLILERTVGLAESNG